MNADLQIGWTSRLKTTDLITDRRAGIEVIETIQSFLDRRNAALPAHIRSLRQDKHRDSESQQEFDNMGIDFTEDDIIMFGGDTSEVSPIKEKETAFCDVSPSSSHGI